METSGPPPVAQFKVWFGRAAKDIRAASSMSVPRTPIQVLAADLKSRCAPWSLYLAAALVLALPTPSRGQAVGDLGVSPTRIVLEGRTRTAQISLLNKGSQPATYRISIVNMRMTETGKFETIEEPEADQKFADRLIRFAPRQVTLEPGATQTVRVMLRKPKDLPPGEYRSHLYFRAVPPPGAGRSVEATGSSEGIQISLTVIPGVTIPLIVRQGTLSATATLSDFRFVDLNGPEGPKLSFRINRKGDRSLFGDVTAAYFAAGSDREFVVARANKLAVYAPNASRVLVLPLRLPDGVRLKGGRLRVTYQARPEEGGQVIGQADIDVP
ncbi:MAG: molecular chaperone [Kiloniellaceae bacterium]